MNGRLYDPILGRFLSPDNYVQMPDYTQNFNRYSYALNNPLVYTDPDGEFVLLAIAGYFLVNAAIDYGMQVGMNYMMGYKGKDAWVNKVDFLDVGIWDYWCNYRRCSNSTKNNRAAWEIWYVLCKTPRGH